MITITLKEDKVHYKEHFKYLFQWIDEYCENKTKDCNDFYAQVIDFSMAEKRGFVDAFIEHKLEKVNVSSYPKDLLDSHKVILEREALWVS